MTRQKEEVIIDRLAKKYLWWSPLSAERRTDETETGALEPKRMFEGKNKFIVRQAGK
jgi:hypothetical protein